MYLKNKSIFKIYALLTVFPHCILYSEKQKAWRTKQLRRKEESINFMKQYVSSKENSNKKQMERKKMKHLMWILASTT